MDGVCRPDGRTVGHNMEKLRMGSGRTGSKIRLSYRYCGLGLFMVIYSLSGKIKGCYFKIGYFHLLQNLRLFIIHYRCRTSIETALLQT